MNRKALHVGLHLIIWGIVLCLSHIDVKAQQYEVGFGLGGATYSGDIIRKLDPSQVGIQGTLFGRRNFDNAWSLRAGLQVARLNAADSIRPIDPVALARNAHFRGTMWEFSAVMEFHFLDYLAHHSTTRFSPYGFFGLGYGFFFGEGQTHELDPMAGDYWVGTPVIPFGLGVKYKLKDRLFLAVEASMRASFSDGLDKIDNDGAYFPKYLNDSSTGNQILNPYALNFGNYSDRDWYYFLGVTLSYSFHQIKCFN